MTSNLPDAAPGNWVDRHAPPRLRPWLRLARLDRPAGIWLLMLPGWQGVALASAGQGRWPDPWPLAAILLGAVLMRAAGCAFNDIVDRDLDAKVARTRSRPIPAGEITPKGALAFAAACCLISLGILLTLPLVAIILGGLSLVPVAIYPFMKRITWWPQAWLGLTFNWGALLGYAAAAGRLEWPAVVLYLGGLFWTLGYDTAYAVQDLEDDALAGVKSSARRLGAAAPMAVAGFYIVAFILALVAAWIGGLGPLFLPLAAVYGLMLSRQAARLDITDPKGALAIFKSNTWAGLVLFAALVAGLWRPAEMLL